jgi:hypothetical protein
MKHRDDSIIRANDAAVEKVDYSSSEKQLNASITVESSNDEYELEYDPILGVTRRKRKARKRAYQLNQLDHNRIIWKRRRKGLLIGFGLIAAIQGLLMASILGIILGMMGVASGTVALLKSFKGLMQPFTDQVQNILQFADQNGLPMDKLEEQMLKKVKRHFVSTRLLMYAGITLFGRGMGSTWLGISAIGVGIVALPGIYESAVALGSGLGLLQQGIDMAMPQIRRYQHLYHPEHVERNIRAGLEWYKNNSHYYQQKRAAEHQQQHQQSRDTLAATLPLRSRPRPPESQGLSLPPINLSPQRLQGLVEEVGKVASATLQQTQLDEALMAFAGSIYQR